MAVGDAGGFEVERDEVELDERAVTEHPRTIATIASRGDDGSAPPVDLGGAPRGQRPPSRPAPARGAPRPADACLPWPGSAWYARLVMLRYLTLGLGLLSLSLAACESSGSVGDEPVSRCFPAGACDEAMLQQGLVAAQGDAHAGAELFAQNCARCHGPTGHGVEAAERIDMTSPSWQARLRDGQIAQTVRAGRPPVMPAFRFTDDQLRNLLAYVRQLEVAPAPTPKPGY